MTDGHLFSNILLGGRGGTNPGQLRVHSRGIAWKKQGGGKVIEVDKADIAGCTWMKVPRMFQLGVRIKDGLSYKFMGFREQDVSSLSSFIQKSFGVTTEEKQLSVSGRNWGDIDINGNMMTFMVGSKQAFEISLADVAQTQLQGKNDVFLEFHVDDTTGANEKDTLMDMCFHVPNSNTQFIGDENRPPAQVLMETIAKMADVGSSSEEAVAGFDGVAILTPRGRYSVELHLSFFRLQGQANDFKIQYNSVVRLFLLPKSNQPHTFVVITLDPPIRKGQTMYPHIVMQFETDYVVESTLSLSEEHLNTKYKGKLESSYKGLIHEVFTMILRGLSGAKVTRPGKFRSCHDGYAVKSSLKAEDGILYPLERGFFFLPKPPTLILHEEIEYVEFERHGAGGSSSMSSHYFDLLVKLRNDQEHSFRNIQRNEYHNLFDFISSKGLKILNLGAAQTTNGVAAVLGDDDDDAVDPHLERIKNAAGEESDEEDEDFVAEKDDGGSPTDDSEEDSDASESGEEKEKTVKKDQKKELITSKVPSKKKAMDGDDEGSKKKRKKKKKDPNAPKRALSAFMFFANTERDNVKRSTPGISFTDVGRILGEKWKKMSGEEKEPYEDMARKDQKRYKNAMAEYNSAPIPINVDSGNEDSD